MGRKGDPDRIDDADLEIGASVKAKSMRFREKPKTNVEVHGEVREPDRQTDLETTSGSERRNLPDEVEPGVTYRDVAVRWRAAVRIEDPAADDEEEDQDA
jgi:hypothetical protein